MRRRVAKLREVPQESAGTVVFHRRRTKTEYLLLYGHSPGNPYWGLPKGIVELGEDTLSAAKRETKEETGLGFNLVPGFKRHVRYSFRWKDMMINKTVTYFLARAKTKAVKISYEHEGYAWFTIRSAVKTAPHNSTKRILKEADEFISSMKHAPLGRTPASG
jgi:8-oxo-dGTP pyrophosphatase MutT (NUDIX family)